MVALQLMSVSDRQIYLIGSRLNMVALQHTIYTASGNTCGSSRLNMVALQLKEKPLSVNKAYTFSLEHGSVATEDAVLPSSITYKFSLEHGSVATFSLALYRYLIVCSRLNMVALQLRI